MNLDLLKQKETKAKVQTSEKYPTLPVITLLAENRESDSTKTNKMIKFNINALNTLNIGTIGREDYNRIVMFDKYLVSNPDEEDRYDICLFATNQKTIKANKNYKSYEIAMGTRRMSSSDIYDAIVERFNLDSTQNNYIQLIPTDERTGGGFTLSLITENKPVNIFDKGEDVQVEMTQF